MNQADTLILSQLAQMTPHSRTCRTCGASFDIDSEDLEFYKKMITPPPTLCRNCRWKKKLVFRNEINLHKRECYLCKKPMISIYNENSPITVYCNDCWWGDKWDQMDFGIDYDSDRSFFDQLKELYFKIPHPTLTNTSNENSEFSNYIMGSKDCYMATTTYKSENILYSNTVNNCRTCVDSLYIDNAENCYQCFNVSNSSNSQYLFNSNNCVDCYYSSNLSRCSNCILCTNLQDKSYYYKNEPISKDEFADKLKQTKTDSQLNFLNFYHSRIVRNLDMKNCEDSTGDILINCKNAKDCFVSVGIENCRYSTGVNVKNCFDFGGGDSEYCYEVCTAGKCNNNKFCFTIYNNSCFNEYSLYLYGCENCFGCVGLRHKKFCILNKQYSEKEYNLTIEKIKIEMLGREEYGEFFPISMSPFGYNESASMEYEILSKDKAISEGFNWSDNNSDNEFKGQSCTANPDINYYKDEQNAKELLASVLKCEISGKPYKIIPQELAFYLTHDIQIPKRCPYQRHLDMLEYKNPFKLWSRPCMKCGKYIKTSYAPERKEIVYCEECYREKVY